MAVTKLPCPTELACDGLMRSVYDTWKIVMHFPNDQFIKPSLANHLQQSDRVSQ
jgi:hypothetical protein